MGKVSNYHSKGKTNGKCIIYFVMFYSACLEEKNIPMAFREFDNLEHEPIYLFVVEVKLYKSEEQLCRIVLLNTIINVDMFI